MQDFTYWYESACKAVGSKAALEKRMPDLQSAEQLAKKSDAHFLSFMCLRVFQSGLQHKMVLDKWPRFEEVYFGFDPQKIVRLSDEQLETKMQSGGLIRHWRKTLAIRTNAQMVMEVSGAHGSFGAWLACWPVDNAVDLWRFLKKEGAHLGGHSGPRFLRMVGYDTFLLSEDVVVTLKAHGVIDRAPGTIKELAYLQSRFSQWAAEGGRPQAHVSRMISLLAPMNKR